MSSCPNSLLMLDAEDHLSRKNLERISSLVEEMVGIKLPIAKNIMIEGRLRKRVHAVGVDDLDAYCAWLFDQNGLQRELPYLIDALTTNKTDFFREPEHYHYLERLIVPELLKLHREPRPLLKIWSAACSNGAEAYSAAMVLADFLGTGRHFNYAILGTDVSMNMLTQARRAVYPIDMIAPVPPGKKAAYVMQARQTAMRSKTRIAPSLRRHVNFRYLNLMDDSYPIDRDVDVVFLRNVLIYFEKSLQNKVIGKTISHLRPGGYLLLGHSESMIDPGFSITQIAPAVFRKN